MFSLNPQLCIMQSFTFSREFSFFCSDTWEKFKLLLQKYSVQTWPWSEKEGNSGRESCRSWFSHSRYTFVFSQNVCPVTQGFWSFSFSFFSSSKYFNVLWCFSPVFINRSMSGYSDMRHWNCITWLKLLSKCAEINGKIVIC